jgi:polysaccharide pyruvyl transferase WcaK-like protein
MRIIIDQAGHGFRNFGDWAMVQVVVDRCRASFSGCDIHVFGADVERIRQCIPEVQPLCTAGRSMVVNSGCLLGRWSQKVNGIDARLVRKWPRIVLPLLRLRYRGRGWPEDQMERFLEVLSAADLVIASGGSYLTDEFPETLEGISGLLTLAHRLGKHTAMLGQGLGPLKDRRLRRMASAAMRPLRLLALREKVKSLDLASELGVTADRVVVTGDDAIEPAFALRRPSLGDGLGLNIRVQDYSGVTSGHLYDLRMAIGRVLSDLNTHPVIVPISFYGDEDVRNTRLVIPEKYQEGDGLLHCPADVMRLVGNCRVMITGSYHAGVFALSQGIPTVTVAKSSYYIHKFEGLASQFGEGCEFVRLDDPELINRLYAVTMDLWDRADDIRPNLLACAGEQIMQSNAAFHRLAECCARN